MKSPAKKLMTGKSCPPCAKDWHGSHWHMVGWLSAVAIVLSASTMTLSASAATTPAITPTVLYRAITDVKTQLTRVEAKIDALNTKCAAPAGQPAQCPTGTNSLQAPNLQAPTDRTQAPSDQVPSKSVQAPTADPTKCRLSCEDDFNACAKAANNDVAKYTACKQTYESCYTACGQ